MDGTRFPVVPLTGTVQINKIGKFGQLLTGGYRVMFRRLLTPLVLALPVLIVAFAVLMGGHALATAMNDLTAARALLWVALSCLMLLCGDVLLMVGMLGLQALARREPPTDDPDQAA